MRPDIARARQLRRNMSDPEIILWSRLKQLRDHGYRFRRQAPFHGYFLDFVCFSRRLIVEVDGGQHADERQAEHDAIRDRIAAREGFRVLRFWAGDVRRNTGGVMDQIVRTLEAQGSVREAPSPGFPTLAAARPVPPH